MPGQEKQHFINFIIISYLLKWIEVIPNRDVTLNLLIPVHPKTHLVNMEGSSSKDTQVVN